jgi:uncharacterized protein (DUF885 family)
LSSVEERFLELVAREWRWRLEEFPLLATRVGVREFDDRLAEESIEAYARRAEATRHFLEVLQGIPKEELPKSRQVDYDMFREQLEDRLAAYRFGEHFMPLNSDSGFHTEYALLPKAVYLETAQDYENYLARMRQVPKRLQENLSLLSRGLELGLTPPKVTLQGIESTLQRLVSENPEAHPLFEPFQSLPTRFPPEKREEWRSEARKLLTAEIIPSYRKVASFLLETYLPRCRDTLSVQSLPQGSDYYRFLIRRFTTLPLEAREIHELGQREVAAIRAAMDGVRKEVGFTGTHEAFLEFLRNDPQFYARSPEELLTRARSIAKKMDAKLPALFRRLPRQPYGVMAVPDSLAPKYTAGRYSPSPRESTEPGWYWVNTYALEKRPLYNLVALTLHEAVPGHHLQHALAEEAEGILPFRRYTYLSAFGEGWGLYAEWLGLEAGLYETPYERFGLLGYQAWRAARLVVDTGIHAFGWTRDQAIAYLAENTTLPLHEVETEVDRYISWPGQALSYYIGYLEIRKLREKAEQTLGERFDVRAFHDLVLEEGSVPLPVLRQRVEQWLATQRGNF